MDKSTSTSKEGTSRNKTTSSISIGGNPLKGHIRDLPTVRISHMVFDVLDPAVGEGHPVGPGGHLPVPLLLLPKVSAAVVVGDSVLVGVNGGLDVVTADASSAAANTTFYTADASSAAANTTTYAADASSAAKYDKKNDKK